VVVAFVFILVSFALLSIGYGHEHAHIMLYAGLLLFPHSVAISYLASAARSRSHAKQVMALSLLSIPLMASPLIALWRPLLIPLATFLPASLAAIPVSISLASAASKSLRLSLILFALTYLASSSIILTFYFHGFPGYFSIVSLAMTLAYPLPLIYSVTVHSLPSTFQDRPSFSMSVLSVALAWLSAFLTALGDIKAGIILGITSTITMFMLEGSTGLGGTSPGLERG
jgi:hypothetical protein